MKRLITLASLTPAMAYAHAGDHSGHGPAHALAAPDHLAVLALLAGVAGLVIWAVVRR